MLAHLELSIYENPAIPNETRVSCYSPYGSSKYHFNKIILMERKVQSLLLNRHIQTMDQGERLARKIIFPVKNIILKKNWNERYYLIYFKNKEIVLL